MHDERSKTDNVHAGFALAIAAILTFAPSALEFAIAAPVPPGPVLELSDGDLNPGDRPRGTLENGLFWGLSLMKLR